MIPPKNEFLSDNQIRTIPHQIRDLINLGLLEKDWPHVEPKAYAAAVSGGKPRPNSDLSPLADRLIQEYGDILNDKLPDTPISGPPMVIRLKPNARSYRVYTARQVP